jgi:hypothetical protein
MPHPFTARPARELPLPISSHLFWYCTDCREVFRATPFDDAPQYAVQGCDELGQVDDTLVEEPCNERERFLQRHHGHRLGILKRVKDKILPDRPVWDPMRTVYEEVTDGQKTFLLKSWREDVFLPRCYLLLNGSLVVEEVSATLEEELLRGALYRGYSFPAATIDHLIVVIQKTVAALPPEELTPAYDSGTDPNLVFAYLSGHHLDLLLRRCLQVVGKEDSASLRRFFLTRHYSEELTVAVRQQLHPCFT